MRFDYSCFPAGLNDMHYYITITEPYFLNDKDIAEKLNLSLEEYQKILESFGACKETLEMFFHDKLDCQNALDYLNEKYGVLLALLGE
jgi:hypothetical protein